MKDKINIKDIISGCIRNERRAQEQLFRLYYGKMLVVIYRYITDKDSAQEVLQNAFIKVFEKLATYNNQGSFDGWLRRIVVNSAIDAIRKNKIYFIELTDVNQSNEFDDPLEAQEIENEIELNHEKVLEAIEQLSPAYRMVFNLYVVEEFTHKKIAETLGISEGASKSNLAKARKKLMKILSNQLVTSHGCE